MCVFLRTRHVLISGKVRRWRGEDTLAVERRGHACFVHQTQRGLSGSEIRVVGEEEKERDETEGLIRMGSGRSR